MLIGEVLLNKIKNIMKINTPKGVYTHYLCGIQKSQSHKQHIWFFANWIANPEKPKELFFANA